MAKEDTQQSVVNPWELDWHNVNVKQDSQSFGRKAKDLGLGIVNTGRNVSGGIAKGVVGIGQAVKGIADFADTVTDGGMAVNPVGLGLKAYDKIAGTDNYQQLVNAQKNARQKAMNAVDNWVDNSDSFAADLARNTGFGKTTQDTKGFGNAIQQNITNYVQSQGMRDSINRRAEQNALEQQRWNALSDDEKTLGARLGHWGNIAGNVISNPLATLDDTVVSATEMVGGGRLLKGVNFGLKALQGTKAGAKALGVIGGENAAKAAITEGLIAGGHNVAETKNELGDEFDKKAALKSGLSGITTGAIALGGNRLGRALGVADIDEMLVAGAKNTAKGTGGKLGRLGAVAKGAIQEGLLEELPQGMAETALQNWATGKPITEGMAENAISGAMAGGLMGGAGSGVHYQAQPDKGFGFRPASKVTAKERKKYADSIAEQQQAQAERVYSGSTDLDSEDARINQHISRQAQQGFDFADKGQYGFDLSAMRQDLTPSNRLGLRRDYQGGGALENTAALAVDSGATSQLAISNEQLASGNNGVNVGLLPQSQLGDDLMNTQADNSVISSSGRAVLRGRVGGSRGGSGATGGRNNITISNPPTSTLDGIKGFGIGQGISQSETLSEQPKLGVKGVSASNQNQVSVSGSLNNQLATNRNQLKTPTQYTAKEQETIRRIESTPNKGRDMAVIGRENFTPNMVDYVVKNNRSVAVDKLAPAKAKELGFAYPDDVRRTIHKGDIEHTLARHGENSDLVKKSGQKPVTKANIANWTKYADRADITVQSKDDSGNDVVISGKQINGYYAVVEQIRKGRNELSFKTMYFQKGNIKDHKEFKKRFEPNSDNVSANHHAGYEPATQLGVGNSNRLKTSENTQTLLQGYKPDANSFASSKGNQTIPQTAENANSKQGVSASKKSPKLRANLMQFGVGAKKIELDKKRTQVFTNPETARKANKIKQQNVIQIGVDTKNKALEVAYIYGLEETHTPRKEIISGKWHLVKNTYWEEQQAKDEKEQAIVSDAVKNIQAATAKIEKQVNQAKTITATPSPTSQTTTTQAVASSSVPIQGKTQSKNTAKKANQPTQTGKNAQNETKNATILGSKAKITAKNNKILQKSAEKRGDKAKSQDKQAEIQRLKDEYEQAKKGKFAAGMAYRLGETELEMRKIHAKNGEKHQSDYAHLSEEKLNQQIAKYKAEESEYEKQQAKISNQIAQLAVGNDYGNVNLPYIDENTGKFNAHQFVEIVNDKSKSLDERRLAARHLLQAAFNNQQSSLVEDNLNMSKAVDKIMQMAKNGKVQPTKEFSEEIKRIVQSSAYKSNGTPQGTIANLILKFAENPKDYAYANLMAVSQDEINEAKQHGLNISGYVHLIDTDAIRHIRERHGNEKKESKRGLVAIVDEDFVHIPEITANPDKRIYGGKTPDGKDSIVSVKRMADNSTVVVEEVRTGRKKLAVKTMYKHTATVDMRSIIKNIEHSQPYAQDDSGRVVTDIKAQTVPKDNQSSVSNKSVSQSKKAKDDKQAAKQSTSKAEASSNAKSQGGTVGDSILNDLRESKKQVLSDKKLDSETIVQFLNSQIQSIKDFLDDVKHGINIENYNIDYAKMLHRMDGEDPTKRIQRAEERIKEYKRLGKEAKAYLAEIEKDLSNANAGSLKNTESDTSNNEIATTATQSRNDGKVSGSLKDKIVVISDKIADLWVKSLGLKSLNDEYIPKIPQEVQDKIGKQIKVKKGSLLKLITRRRTKYIPEIKPTFETPDTVIKDKDGLLFIKQINDDTYFVNVNIDKGDYWVSISQSPRTIANIENKFKAGAEVLYRRSANPKTNSPTQPVQTFTDFPSSANSNGDTSTDIKTQVKGKGNTDTEILEVVKRHAKEPNFAENLEKALQDKIFKILSDEYKAVSKRIEELRDKTKRVLPKYEFEIVDLLEKKDDLAEDLNSEFVRFSNPKYYTDTIENRVLTQASKEALQKAYAVEIEKEIPVAQWVVSTVRDDNLDPTTIRSTGNIESLIKNAQSVNTKLTEYQKAVEKQGYENSLDYKHRLAETVSNNYSPKEKRLLAAEMLAKVMYETGRKSKIEKYHDKQAIARRVVALTERNKLNYHQVSFEIEHLLKNGDFSFAKMKKNGKVTPDTLYPEYPAKKPTNALEYVGAFEKSLNLDIHGRNIYQEWFDDIVDFINQGNVSIGNQWTFQDAIMRIANGEITIEKNKLQDSQSTVTLDLDKWFERVFLRFADYIQNAKEHYAKKRYSLSEKADKQQQYAQTLYSKANAIRESKASVEHKNAVIDAAKAVVGEENIQHIDITTASELQRKHKVFQSWRADEVAQIEGFQNEDTGRITLVSNVFDDLKTAAFVAWHELAHRGIGVKGRKEYRKAMVALANKHKFYRRVAAKYYGRYKKNENLQDFTPLDALEESLADLYAAYKTGDWATFEQRNGVKVSENLKKYSERNSIQRLWNEFKAIVSQIFGIQSQALSDKQLFALLRGLDGVQGYEFDPKTHDLKAVKPENRYSLSAMKSVLANITRGKKAMNKALLEKNDIHRAMYRNDIGWVDFVYGDDKKGLQHIIKRRMESDNMTRSEAVKLLTEDITRTIAQGETQNEKDFVTVDKSSRLRLYHNGTVAILTKRKGGNGWLLTGFVDNENLQTVKQVRSATNSALRTAKPILSRQGVGASVSVSDSLTQNANENKRFSLASNNRAIAKINQFDTRYYTDEDSRLQMLFDEFEYNSPNEELSPKHKKLFDKARKAKNFAELKQALLPIQTALQNGEIENSQEILKQFSGFFEKINNRQDLKQYSKADLQAIADNPNFKAWFKDAHKFFKNADGTPKVFYRGLDVNRNFIQQLANNADKNTYGAEFYTDNAIIADTYRNEEGIITQVALNAENPFIVPYIDNNDFNNLLDGYYISQVVRLFKKAGFHIKPDNWSKFTVPDGFKEDFAKTNDKITFYLQVNETTGRELTLDKNPLDTLYQYKNGFIPKFNNVVGILFNNNDFVRNLKLRGEYDSVVFKNINDGGWYSSKTDDNFGDIPKGTVLAVWGTEDNQAYAKELGNKGTFSKEDKRIFYSLKKSGSLKEQDTIKKQIQQNADKLQAMNPVANISGKAMTKAEVIEYMQQTGGFVVDIQYFGQVEIGKNEISDSYKYANKDAERLTYKAIKPVLKRGIRITDKADHKGRGYPTVTFAAPVVVNGVRGNMGVVVKQTNKNHYKMHRILTPNGEVFELVSVEPTMPVSTPSATSPHLGEVNLSIGSTPDSNAVTGGTSNSTTDFVRTTANATGKTAPVSNTANAVTDIKAQTVPNGKTRFSLNTAQSEFDATAKQYGGEKAYNQAKADGKTALNYHQWVQVRTPSFKAWFGDWENDPENASKVLNPDTGEPLVVYHGTTIQGRRFFQFNTEKPAWFSTYKGYAQAFIGDKGKPTLYTAFLNIRNPVNVGNIDGTVTENSLSTLSEKTGVDISILRKIYDESKGINIFNITNSQQLKSILAKQGVDSISAIEGKVKSFGVFSPEQIKSATDNIGSFDGSNPDIRYSLKNANQPTIKEQIRENADKLNKMPTVASVTGTAKNITALRQEVLQHLKDTGGFTVDIPNFGKVIIDDERVQKSLRYIETPAEQVAYKAIKPVLKRGIRVEKRDNHKDRNYSTVTFAAPVELNGKRALMAVVVKQTGKNYYKIHRVITPNGEVFRLEESGNAGSRRERVSPDNAAQYQGVMPDLSPQHSTDKSVTDNVANSMPTVKQLSGSLKAVKEVVGKDTYDLIHTIIRAENAYGQDETNPKILYSIAKTAEKARLTFGKQLGDMAKDTYGKVRTPLMKVKKSKLFPSGWRVALGNKWKDSLNVQLQFLGRRHIVDIFDRVFDGRLKAYSNLVSDMDAMKNSLSQKHDDLVRDWGKLPTEENDKLVSLMHKATLAQYDPDTKDGQVNYKANWNNKVVKNIDEIKALHRDFNRLSPDAKRIYRQVRDNYKSHYKRVQVAMQERILRLTDGMDNTQRKAIVEKMNNHFADGLSGVYFPLQRFGDYVVVAKDKMGKTISVSRAESANQAEEIRREYLRDFPKDKGFSVLPVQLSKDYVQSRDGAGRAFIQNLIGEFANRPNLLDGDQFDEVADIVEQMWLASMPDLSWAKHGIHRKGTAGYSEKARRAYAANMIHGTNYLARLTYSDQLQTALDGMQEFIDNNAANEEFNHIVAQRVQNEMEKRHENLMRPNSHPLATKLTGLGFVWYLGLSPASAIVNLTQTWLVGLPVIGAKYGNWQTAKALAQASGQTLKGAKKDGFTFDISGSLNSDEKAAFDRAVADGTIDTSQAYDLAGIADGHEDAVYFKYQRFMRGVAKMFHEAEVFNRQATFIAVYRLARQKGMSSEAAYQEAKDLTYKSHFDYATSNRARVLQGNWQRVIFLFKQFGFNMLYTVYRNAYVGFLTGIAGTKEQYTAEERKQARQAVLMMGATHFAVAGALGLPLVGTILSVMTMLAHAGGADDDWDAEEEMKKAFAAVLGKKGGNAMSYGLTRYLGVDLHGRLGLHDMIFPDVQENLEGQDWAERFTVGMSGAVVGMWVNFAKGLNQVHNGEVLKGAESMLPTVVRNGIKSYRLATQGQVDRTGVVVKDDFNAAEIATTAIGFNPASLRRAMEAKSAILNTENRKNKARTALMSAYAKARMDGDKKAMQKVLQEINEWNRKNPTRRIEPKNLQASLKNRQRRIANAKHGVYLSDSHQDAYQENSYLLDE